MVHEVPNVVPQNKMLLYRQRINKEKSLAYNFILVDLWSGASLLHHFPITGQLIPNYRS